MFLQNMFDLDNVKSNNGWFQLGLLLIVFCTLPFSLNINALSVGAFVAFQLIFNSEKKPFNKYKFLIILCFGAFFWLCLLDLRDVGFKKLEFLLRILPLALIPLSTYYQKHNYLDISKITILLSISSFIAIFYGIFVAIEFYTRPDQHFSLIHLPHTIKGNYHSVYFAIQLGVNTILALFCFKKERSPYYLIISVLFILFIIILGKRMALISLILVGLIYSISFFKIKNIFLFLGIIGLFTLIYAMSPYNRWRADQIANVGEGSERIIMLQASKELTSENLFFGVSTSQVSTELGKIYDSYDLKTPFFSNNPHNQLLYILLSFGITGFIAFLVSQVYLIVLAIKTKYHIFIVVYTFFLMVAMTETILIRQQGIVLYSMILSQLLVNKEFYEKR